MIGIENFKFLKLKFSMTAIDNILFPKNLKGNIFRGAFGLTLKKLVCNSELCCSECEERDCLYNTIFEPHNENAPSGLKNIPRPFVITHTEDEREVVYPGESFNIGFNIFGNSWKLYPHFIKAVEEIGKEGIGPLRGKFIVRTVFYEDENGKWEKLLENGNIKSINPITLNLDYETINNTLKTEFITPTKIIYNGEVIKQPEFYHIFSRIRDRVSSILSFYNDTNPEVDFKLLEEISKNVKTIEKRFNWTEVKRRSSKTKLLQDLSGIKGYAIYEFSDLEEAKIFYPWLKLAEITNIGKNSVWGMGKIKTEFNLKLSEVSNV